MLETLAGVEISVCINWARSAIEGRNTTLPLSHTQRAQQAGKLRGLMFSGTTQQGAYGEWQDLHAPFAPFCAESLLTVDRASALFNATANDNLLFSGIKLLEIDARASVDHRVAILRDGITALNKARQ